MRKLQELRERIGHKLHPKPALIERLRIPGQQEQHSDVFPTAPDAVKSWLITQDAFNSASMVKTLTRALQHSNRTITTPELRLQTMDHFENPFVYALKSLDAHYLYVDFPLSNEAESAFQTAFILCQEMAYGYKIALADSLRDGKLGKTQKQLALSRSLEHTTRLVLRHSHIYREWPNDIWSDANTLIRIARLEQVDKLAMSNIIKKDTVTLPSIENQYAKLCLFQLFDDNHQRPEQLQALLTTLSAHCAEVTFSTTLPNTENSEKPLYCVGESNPPALIQFCRYKKADKLLYFSLDSLLGKIKNEHQPGNYTASESILSPGTHKRKTARTPRANLIKAETGLTNIFSAIRTSPPTDLIESQFTDVKKLLSGSSQLLAMNDNLNSADQEKFSAEFLVDNQSSGGLGLSWSGKGNCKIRVGELIAHCYKSENNEVSWYIGVVRWIKTKSDQSFTSGIEMITEHANAVEVHRLVKDTARTIKPTAALLANCQLIDSKVKMLILPLHQYKPGETVGYRDCHGFNLVKLIESVELGGGFQCFAITSATQDNHKVSASPAIAAVV